MDKLVKKCKTIFQKEREETEGQRSVRDLADQMEQLIKNSEDGAVSFVQLGSLQTEDDTPQSDTLGPEDSNIGELTNDLDDATADMMAMFRKKSEDSECSSNRSSLKSKYSIMFETDNSEGEEEEADCEEDLERKEESYQEFARRQSLSISLGPSDESRLSLLTPAGRIIDHFQLSVSSAVDIVRELEDNDPMKIELLYALQEHLSVLREEVRDNMNLTLLSSLVVDLEPITEEQTENTDD